MNNSDYVNREEHARTQRRRARQMLGLLIAVLVVVGVVSIVRGGLGLLGRLFDDTAVRAEYADKLEGLVMFDPLPFDGMENIDDLTLREAAIWGCVYNIQDVQGNFDRYEHEAETDRVMLPSVEVDAYLAKVTGPNFKLTHQTVEMEDMTVEYDEKSQSYLIPVTGGVGSYTPVVTSLFKQSGRLHVTVGYIPTNSNDSFTASSPDTPTKYMDYLFERQGGHWYLVGLAESATKPEATAAPSPVADSVLVPDELENQIIAGLTGDDAASSEESTAAPTDGEAEADTSAADGDTADTEQRSDTEATTAA